MIIIKKDVKSVDDKMSFKKIDKGKKVESIFPLISFEFEMQREKMHDNRGIPPPRNSWTDSKWKCHASRRGIP